MGADGVPNKEARRADDLRDDIVAKRERERKDRACNHTRQGCHEMPGALESLIVRD